METISSEAFKIQRNVQRLSLSSEYMSNDVEIGNIYNKKIKTNRRRIMSLTKKEQFINKSIAKYGNKYDYSKVIYTGTHDRVILVCPIHGDFEVTPSKHLSPRSTECRGCKGWVPSNEEVNQEFVKKWYNYFPETGIMTVRATGRILGSTAKNTYLRTRIGEKQWDVHRLAFLFMCGKIPEMVDHKNRNIHDNSWNNLRATTNTMNQWNVEAHSIIPQDNGTWRVQKYVNNKSHSKIFKTREEAIAASLRAKEKLLKIMDDYHKQFIDNDIV